MRHYLTFGVLLGMLCVATAAEPVAPTPADKIRVLAVLSVTKKEGVESRAFSAVAVNLLGQVIYMRRWVSNDKPLSFVKIGPGFVSYVNAKITSDATGRLTFDFEKATAGSSIVAIGKDGTVKDYFSLPVGIFPDSSGDGYFANIEMVSPSELPFADDSIEADWLSAGKMKGFAAKHEKLIKETLPPPPSK